MGIDGVNMEFSQKNKDFTPERYSLSENTMDST